MTLSTRQESVHHAIARLVLVIAVLATTLVSMPFNAPAASAQAGNDTLEVWGISGGITNNPKQWKFAQSFAGADIGSATAASMGYDDSSWSDVQLRWKEFPGSDVANHFRKDFTLAEIGVELFQIEAIKVSMNYDDSAVMYLNGVEVYRSIRGNLDRGFDLYPPGADIPHDVEIEFGGFENEYINIPDPDNANDCERYADCSQSPYVNLAQDPPAVPVGLLIEDGVNTWAVTTWNQSGGGSGDSALNHTFELMVDPDAVPPNSVFINEVMATNDGAYEVQLDDDAELETPDWFELVNTDEDPVNLSGWTISDDSASWTFPNISIPGNGYLVVAANDKDISTSTPMQTNFKISKEGDTLKLTNAEGFVADEYATMQRQFADNSYGRPNNAGAVTYLGTSTPGQANSAAGDGYAPILRLFPHRMYNVGETVSHQIDAFDPDGDTLSYSLTPMPAGLTVSPEGLISGVITTPGTSFSQIVVTDSDNDQATSIVQWVVVPAVDGPAPIVLNEYNAVAGDREFLAGSELGNGGDWYEFVVVQDNLDLRGYTFEFWDMKGPGDQLRRAAVTSIVDDVRFGRAPAGTIITLSQLQPDDLSFNAVDDWHINFQIDNDGAGAFVEAPAAGSVFNSTRSGQVVLIKDATGNVVTPLSGETEAWDTAAGGVSGAEVMSLCASVAPGMVLDPVADYSDNGVSSSFGQPNACEFVDPVDGTVTVVSQSLDAVRSTSTLGAHSGDANCDMRLSVSDALAAAQYSVGNRVDSGPCFFEGSSAAGFTMSAAAADFTGNDRVSVQDALAIAQCSVGLSNQWCPAR